MPWWHISMQWDREEHPHDPAEIELWIEAPSSKDAVMVALGSVDESQSGHLHMIHVGAPMDAPNKAAAAQAVSIRRL